MSDDPTIVQLNAREITLGAIEGVMRVVKALITGRPAAHGLRISKQDRWAKDIEGALAEMAAAKYLAAYWTNRFGSRGDVGRYEIRSTEHQNGHLLVYDSDPDDTEFILVTGSGGRYRVCGKMLASKAKEYPNKSREGREGHWVPQGDLSTVLSARRG